MATRLPNLDDYGLSVNPYLDAGNVSGAILAGQQDAIEEKSP